MKQLHVGDSIAACARIGYRNVEVSLISGFPTEPSRLTPALRLAIGQQVETSGIQVSSLLANFKLTGEAADHVDQLEQMRIAAEFARELGRTGHQPVIQTGVGGEPAEWEQQKTLIVERLRDFDAIAREYEVSIAIKAHVNSAVNSPDRLLWMRDQVGGTDLVVAYDHAHYALGGIPFERSLPPLVSDTRFVHVKEAEGNPADYHFLLPGEGRTDFVALFKLLVASGYRGPVVAEVSSQIFTLPGYDPITAAEKCFAALAPAVAEAGG